MAVELEPLDASGDCAGLVPQGAPPVVTLVTTRPADSTCLGGTGDGTGHIAVGAKGSDGAATWTVFSTSGARGGMLIEPGLLELTRQPSGWEGISATPLSAPFQQLALLHVSPQGAVDRRTPLTAPAGVLATGARIAEDPGGGAAVGVAFTAVAGNHWSVVDVFRFDPTGGQTVGGIQAMTDSSPVVSFLAAGVSTGGEAVVSYRLPGVFAWSWLAGDGKILTQGQAAQVDLHAADPVLLQPLLDGSIAVRFGSTWSAVIPHLATTASAPPDWLASGSGTRLRFTGGNRGYAVLPSSGEQLPECAQSIELRAPSGRLCGRITVREGSGACSAAPLEQGWDGTLIAASSRDGCSATSCTCTAHVWPRLLGGR